VRAAGVRKKRDWSMDLEKKEVSKEKNE